MAAYICMRLFFLGFFSVHLFLLMCDLLVDVPPPPLCFNPASVFCWQLADVQQRRGGIFRGQESISLTLFLFFFFNQKLKILEKGRSCASQMLQEEEEGGDVCQSRHSWGHDIGTARGNGKVVCFHRLQGETRTRESVFVHFLPKGLRYCFFFSSSLVCCHFIGKRQAGCFLTGVLRVVYRLNH